MNNLTLALTLSLVAQGAHAEMYMNCVNKDQSQQVQGVPMKVNLDEAGEWFLAEDGKSIEKFVVELSGKTIKVNYWRELGSDSYQYSYDFKHRRCDGEQVGEATLELLVNGHEVTAEYSCECGVD